MLANSLMQWCSTGRSIVSGEQAPIPATGATLFSVSVGKRDYMRLLCPATLQWTVVLPVDYVLLVICKHGSVMFQSLPGTSVKKDTGCMFRGDVALLNNASEMTIRVSAGSYVQCVRIPVAALTQAALRNGFWLEGAHFLAGDLEIVSEGAACLSALVDDALSVCVTGCRPVLDESMRLQDSCIVHSWHRNLTRFRVSQTLQNPVLLRARTWLLENLRDEVALNELAAACCVSVRSLYNHFRRELDMTPGEYLRCLRLEQIYRRLIAGQSSSVTAAAIDYGFTNMGRFARQYQQYIGELPSATLERRGAEI